MDKKVDLSIIIVSHNSLDFLRATLNSLATQIDINYETIVVDNKSTDSTLLMLKNEFSDVVVVKRSTNAGFAAANNLGVKKASGDYVLFLNPDVTFVTPYDIKNCLNELKKHKKIGALSPRVNLVKTKDIDVTCHRGFPTPWASFTHFTKLSRLFPNAPLFNQYYKGYLGYDNTHYIDSVGGMFILIPKNIGTELGWWDEDYAFYGEDIDFCYRLMQAGYLVLYYSEVVVLHHKGSTTGMSEHSSHVTTANKETTLRVKKWSIEAMELFYRKHYLDKYPLLVSYIVFIGIKVLYFVRVRLGARL